MAFTSYSVSGGGSASDWAALKRRQEAASGGGQLKDLIGQMQAAQDKANAANEARYLEMMQQFEGLGTAGQARIQESTARQQAASTQDLTSRGLGNTTITGAMSRGIAREGESATQELGERVAMQKAGAMERRTDQGPDMGMFAQLMQAMMQGQGQKGSVISGGLSANASRGLTAFGTPFKYFSN